MHKENGATRKGDDDKSGSSLTLIVPTFAIIIITSLLSIFQPFGMLSPASAQEHTISVKGVGATFPGPYYKVLAKEYHKIEPNVDISYDAIGSGAGIKFFIAQSVDFGASDAPLDETQRSVAKGSIHFPLTIGSIVAAYNIPEIPHKGLKLTGSLLGDIFSGKIKMWNDPKIKALNPGVELPTHEILVVHRSDGSGTTFVWTKYLSIVNPQWNSTVGYGTSVVWPEGIGGNGNSGVADTIVGNTYSIGYVELAYAAEKQMSYASLMNKEGIFIEPTLQSTRAAVSSASISLPAGEDSWANVSLLNAPGKDSYPIASFSYILLYRDMSVIPSVDPEKAVTMVKFLAWAVTDGQELAASHSYVPLPENVVNHDLEILRTLMYGEESLAPAVPEFETPIVVGIIAASFIAFILLSNTTYGGKSRFFFRVP